MLIETLAVKAVAQVLQPKFHELVPRYLRVTTNQNHVQHYLLEKVKSYSNEGGRCTVDLGPKLGVTYYNSPSVCRPVHTMEAK